MPARHKVLLLDDDPDVLELYQEMLTRLPSKPEIHTATSGARALSLLESEPFTLLISDLAMPKMDGLQVLTIVRQKFPQLRTAVLTAISDEQFRARAYAVGVDLFLEKPNTSKEINFMLDCIESLLGRKEVAGFRGVQSKSLVDLIQLESLSQSSSVLKISNGPVEGRIWIQNGEITDATVQDLTGETAFQKILSWKTGNFEILPPDPNHPRRIQTSAQGLLLETAQAIDEAQAQADNLQSQPATQEGAASPLPALAKTKGVEFILARNPDGQVESWGLENPDQIATWSQQLLEQARVLAETLRAGQLNQIEARSFQCHLTLVTHDAKQLCVGFHRSCSRQETRNAFKRILSQWLA